MGMPSVTIAFLEKASEAIKKSDRGIVALILKEAKAELFEIYSTDEIPDYLSESNRKQIQLVLMGYIKAPKKIIVCTQETEGEGEEVDYSESLKKLETKRFDYLVIPTLETDGKGNDIASWIKQKRQNGKKCKAVLPNTAADTEGVINFATGYVVENDITYTTEQYCARIAGIIAGTPARMSCTFAPVPELDECEIKNEIEIKEAIEQGKLIVFHDGEKVKIASGVNSLVTTTDEKGEQHKKIKILEAIDMIYDDIKKTCQDNYIGKRTNSYNDKCILVNAILGYLKELEGIVNECSVGIDITATKAYLRKCGIDTTGMDDEEIKKADTRDQVFLRGNLILLDVMEEITLPFSI